MNLSKRSTETPEQIEARCKRIWSTDAAIRAEFVDLELFTAYEKAYAAGQIRILGEPRGRT